MPLKSGPEPSSNNFLKVVAALSLLLGAAYIAMGGYQKVQPTAAINNGNTGEGPGQGFDRRQIAREVGITKEQQAELDKVRASGDWRAMREASERILTEDQREKMREVMRANREARDRRARAMLSPADYQAMRERRPNFGGGRGQGGPGGGRGGDAQRGPGARPPQ